MARIVSSTRKCAEEAAFDALPLVEQNAIKLANLEQEWSVLGPLRILTFTVELCEEPEANALAQAAVANGFDVEVSDCGPNETFRYVLEASRQMEPSAQEVTRWENWFQQKTSAVPSFEDYQGCPYEGAVFVGWSYPKRLSPAFSIRDKPRNKKHQHLIGSEERTRILFGETLCAFEGSNGWADQGGASKSGPFQIVPSEFIDHAKRHRPQIPEPTASGFAQWLYSLYSRKHGNDEDMERGKYAEQDILKERNEAFVATDYRTMKNVFPGWRLKHNGMSVREDGKPRYFEINELSVAGQALRVLPDLIYENTNTGARIIVEIKHSYMTIPTNLWPNIWGQLWCYSHMPDILASPSVTVIGEVWGDKSYRPRDTARYVYMRASVRRNPRAPAFDRFFRSLFDIYRSA